MSKKKRALRKKHIPERTCIACRTKRPKQDLVRIVNVPEAGVVIDETGKKNGRGAYLCRRHSCWTRALTHNILKHALRTSLNSADIATLQTYASSFAEFTPSQAVPSGKRISDLENSSEED